MQNLVLNLLTYRSCIRYFASSLCPDDPLQPQAIFAGSCRFSKSILKVAMACPETTGRRDTARKACRGTASLPALLTSRFTNRRNKSGRSSKKSDCDISYTGFMRTPRDSVDALALSAPPSNIAGPKTPRTKLICNFHLIHHVYLFRLAHP
jgi:hypothetical protein